LKDELFGKISKSEKIENLSLKTFYSPRTKDRDSTHLAATPTDKLETHEHHVAESL